MRLAYFVHNLNDAALRRRLRMLRLGGCSDIVVFGFRRDAAEVSSVEGFQAVNLGRTHDARFHHRVVSIGAAALSLRPHAEILRDRDVFMGRNLEALLLAQLARKRFSPNARLVYECLDVHRLFLSGPARKAMQMVEGRLLRRTNLVLVSSPDYDVGYFDKVHGSQPPRLLVENKVLEEELPEHLPPDCRPSGPPWRIGWFGALRCRESLWLLADLVTSLGGLVEVDVRGTPSLASIPDFHDVVARTPHMTFHGAYDRRHDLQRIYSQVHFAWSIDRFEKGMNSDLALSNRLYEGSACGAIIIAETSVAMGRWLRARGTGVLVQDPILAQLTQFFQDLDTSRYRDLADAAASLPTPNYLASQAECRVLVDAIMSPGEIDRSLNAWSRSSVRG